MIYKLIAVDMDGTLLNSHGIITEKTKSAIQLAVQRGIIFTICTGRPIQGVERYNSYLNLDHPFITYNGAMIVRGNSKEILYEQGLTAEDARNVLNWGEMLKTTIIVWSGSKLYVNELNERVHEYKQLAKVEPILIKDEEEIIRNGITKILWYDEVNKINSFQNILRGKLGEGVTYCTSKPIFLEFFDKRVSKALALEKLGEYFGIKADEMITIGDGYNDLDMIKYAGLGIAMGNAPNAIKESADYITLSNDEDGVAYVLDKFIK